MAAGWYVDLGGVNHGFVWQPSTSSILYFNAPTGGTNLQVVAASETDASVTGTFVNAKGLNEGFIASCTGPSCF